MAGFEERPGAGIVVDSITFWVVTNTPATPASSGWELPLDDAPDALYAAVRAACLEADFSEVRVISRFGLASIVDFRSRREGRSEGSRHHDALEVLTDLFMDLTAVPEGQARRRLGDAAVEAMLALRLVQHGALDDGEASEPALLATMLMYPTAGVLLISDRTFGRPGEQRELPPDIVYPAITRNTNTFVRMLPPSPCEAFLEMCAGNGIAAIASASRAGHSWSLDITERATRVARFNARLNGLANVTVLQGDLYQPVRGQTFDRIVAHPPYVPSSDQRIIYRDGGPDGEFITRRLVTELPPFLRPGGRFHATCIVTDRTNAPFELRVREWLGEQRDEFDVVVAVTSAEHPSEYYFKSAINGERSFEDAEQRHTTLKALQVERLVYCSFVIERHATPRPPATARVVRSPKTTGRELEQYADWMARREAADRDARMLAAFPRIDRAATARETRRLVDEKWKASHLDFDVTWPFITSLQCPDDVAQLLARCDGTRTLKQVITSLRQKGLIKSATSDQTVLQIVATCLAAGALHLEDPDRRGA